MLLKPTITHWDYQAWFQQSDIIKGCASVWAAVHVTWRAMLKQVIPNLKKKINKIKYLYLYRDIYIVTLPQRSKDPRLSQKSGGLWRSQRHSSLIRQRCPQEHGGRCWIALEHWHHILPLLTAALGTTHLPPVVMSLRANPLSKGLQGTTWTHIS